MVMTEGCWCFFWRGFVDFFFQVDDFTNTIRCSALEFSVVFSVKVSAGLFPLLWLWNRTSHKGAESHTLTHAYHQDTIFNSHLLPDKCVIYLSVWSAFAAHTLCSSCVTARKSCISVFFIFPSLTSPFVVVFALIILPTFNWSWPLPVHPSAAVLSDTRQGCTIHLNFSDGLCFLFIYSSCWRTLYCSNA